MQLVVIIIQIGQQTYRYPIFYFILYNFFIQNIKFRDFSDVHRQMNKVLKYYNFKYYTITI